MTRGHLGDKRFDEAGKRVRDRVADVAVGEGDTVLGWHELEDRPGSEDSVRLGEGGRRRGPVGDHRLADLAQRTPDRVDPLKIAIGIVGAGIGVHETAPRQPVDRSAGGRDLVGPSVAPEIQGVDEIEGVPERRLVGVTIGAFVHSVTTLYHLTGYAQDPKMLTIKCQLTGY